MFVIGARGRRALAAARLGNIPDTRAMPLRTREIRRFAGKQAGPMVNAAPRALGIIMRIVR